MFIIALFITLGFLIGLVYILVKRKARFSAALTAFILGLLSLGIWKISRNYFKRKMWDVGRPT